MLDSSIVPTPEEAQPTVVEQRRGGTVVESGAVIETGAAIETAPPRAAAADDSEARPKPGAAAGRAARLLRTTRLDRLSRMDRAAIGVVIGAHAALAIVVYCSAWIQGANSSHLPLTRGYQQWDANLYVNYAQHGLFSGASAPNNAAFLPGYPVLLALVHLFVRNWLDSALLLSLIAGCVAAVLLNRMSGNSRAALFLFTAPAAVFLSVPYSESLFLAFALGAWYAAQRADWPVASLLAALAGLTRINGLALIPALVVFALLRSAKGHRLTSALIASAAAIGPFMYLLYLRRATGSWSAWQQANRKGWNIWMDWPATAIRNTWRGAYEYGDGSGAYAWSFQLEFFCTIAAALLVVALLARRAWPEATYCALVLASMLFVNMQQAADRTLLVCFPLYLLLARAANRWPWIGNAYVWVNAPVAVVAAFLYSAGVWSN
ncbi:mannosyltransferase family protein [Actinocrinis sp.]|uniref:mannosyltransferase family protein n=1 Tax=Actinocrinis sp. TaxID=1920516 RepID=UPI002C602AAE|nr:mannosyltransferase family protein [Actinocrinis sp.]HXR71112.1 mannosyltransferase family protein [Actinocrinis sp.]